MFACVCLCAGGGLFSCGNNANAVQTLEVISTLQFHKPTTTSNLLDGTVGLEKKLDPCVLTDLHSEVMLVPRVIVQCLVALMCCPLFLRSDIHG